MRNPSTFLDDLQILLKVFQLAQEVLVYDPKKSLAQSAAEGFEIVDQLNLATNPVSEKKMLINLSSEKLSAEIFDSFDFILEFDSKPNSYKDLHTEIFYFINSPDGTIRWIFPTSLKYPGFLSLYNSSGLKASVFQQVAKLAFQTQTQHFDLLREISGLFKNRELRSITLCRRGSEFFHFYRNCRTKPKSDNCFAQRKANHSFY